MTVVPSLFLSRWVYLCSSFVVIVQYAGRHSPSSSRLVARSVAFFRVAFIVSHLSLCVSFTLSAVTDDVRVDY